MLGLTPTARPPFVGRERELTALWDRLILTSQGHGGVAFVAGEPGVGKTRLVMEVAARARAESWLVLVGRAYDSDGMPPYLPWVAECWSTRLNPRLTGQSGLTEPEDDVLRLIAAELALNERSIE
jgi:predicted ATPase